ncbi:MMPL family transporter [Kitasatospora sp. DSM 101779]|uniref:MMPL family transporter n=1 Tax=Kitasatospora sp. DSM 101779 TaxID=2853165 RepID=UPI0021D99D9A|nr:MMPL family transporter [Kitasatospora sp. DSM 101779]MCU7820696.1 MMPL family transporter [Kitasatospora sp. DSM 101779]
MFTAVGRWCARRPKRVLAAWLLLLAAALAAVGVLGSVTNEAVSIPGSDSQAARDLGDTAFPGSASGRQPLVLHTAADGPLLTSPASTEAVRKAATAIAGVDHVVAVTTPYDPAGAKSIGADGHTGYLSVELDVTGREITPDITDRITAAAAPATAAGIEVTPGGFLAAAVDKGSTGHSEAIGLAAAFVVLALTFGGLVAAGLPLLAGGLGLGISLSVLGLVGHLVDMPSSGETIAAMIGLGVGIDYTLFGLTRFRELLAAGVDHEEAAVRTTAGSGKAVAFAGSAVVAALAGLALGGIPLLYALALAPGIAVLVAVGINLTLLPAVLVLLGPRLAARPRRKAERERPAGPRGWGRVAEVVAARPWRCLVAATVLVGALALPAAQLTFGQLDAGSNATGSASRTAYDRLAAAFGPGINGTLQVTDTLAAPAGGVTDDRVTAVTKALQATPGVAAAGQPQLSADGHSVRWQVTPSTAPSDPATADLVDRLRSGTLPAAAGPGDTTHVGGTPAAQADLNDRLAHRMPLVVGFVLAIAGILLLLAFRAPVVAVKAAVMNLVSVGAAYGVLTAVFQQGHGAGLLGLDGPVPIPGYVPLLMFAVLFGLSMDYEVFLLTAVRTAYLRHRDNRRAVVEGLGGTGRIISSAALIMVSVFLSYLLSDDPVVKMFGMGLATAVALDATVVRGILVPSTMVLLGRGNWWLPRRLDALLPHIDIEGDGTEAADGSAEEPPADAAEPAVAAGQQAAAQEPIAAEGVALPTAAGAP